MCARWFRLDRLAGACWSAQPTSDRTKLVEPARERQRTAVSKPLLAPGRRSRPAGGAGLSGAIRPVRWSAQPTSGREKLVEPARERQRTVVSKPLLAPGRRSRPAGGADIQLCAIRPLSKEVPTRGWGRPVRGRRRFCPSVGFVQVVQRVLGELSCRCRQRAQRTPRRLVGIRCL